MANNSWWSKTRKAYFLSARIFRMPLRALIYLVLAKISSNVSFAIDFLHSLVSIHEWADDILTLTFSTSATTICVRLAMVFVWTITPPFRSRMPFACFLLLGSILFSHLLASHVGTTSLERSSSDLKPRALLIEFRFHHTLTHTGIC